MKTIKELTIIFGAIILWILVYHQAHEWDLLDATKVEYQYDCAGEVKIQSGLVTCAEGSTLRILGAI